MIRINAAPPQPLDFERGGDDDNPINLARRRLQGKRQGVTPGPIPRAAKTSDGRSKPYDAGAYRRMMEALSVMRWSMLDAIPTLPEGGLALMSEDERNRWFVDYSRQILLVLRQWSIAIGRSPAAFEAFKLKFEETVEAHLLHSHWGPVAPDVHVPTLGELTEKNLDLDKMLFAEFFDLAPEAEAAETASGEVHGHALSTWLVLNAQAEDALKMREQIEADAKSMLTEPVEKFRQWTASFPEDLLQSSELAPLPADTTVSVEPGAVGEDLIFLGEYVSVPRSDADIAVYAWDLVHGYIKYVLRDDAWLEATFVEWFKSMFRLEALTSSKIFIGATRRRILRAGSSETRQEQFDDMFAIIERLRSLKADSGISKWEDYGNLVLKYVKMWFERPEQRSRPEARLQISPAIRDAYDRREASPSVLSSRRARSPSRRGSPSRRSAAAAAAAAPAAADRIREEMRSSRSLASDTMRETLAPAWPVADDPNSLGMIQMVKDNFALTEYLLGRSVPSSSIEEAIYQDRKRTMMAALYQAALDAVGYYSISRLTQWITATDMGREALLERQTTQVERLIVQLRQVGGADLIQKLESIGGDVGLDALQKVYQHSMLMEQYLTSMTEVADVNKAVDDMEKLFPGMVKLMLESSKGLREMVSSMEPGPLRDQAEKILQNIEKISFMAIDFRDLIKRAGDGLNTLAEKMAALREFVHKQVGDSEDGYRNVLAERINDVIRSSVEDAQRRTALETIVVDSVNNVIDTARYQESPIDVMIDSTLSPTAASVARLLGAQGFLYRHLGPLHHAQVHRAYEQMANTETLLKTVSRMDPSLARDPETGELFSTEEYIIGSKTITGARFTVTIDGTEYQETVRVSADELRDYNRHLRNRTAFGRIQNAAFFVSTKISEAFFGVLSKFESANKRNARKVDIRVQDFETSRSEFRVTEEIEYLARARRDLLEQSARKVYSPSASKTVIDLISDPKYEPLPSQALTLNVTAAMMAARLRSWVLGIRFVLFSAQMWEDMGISDDFVVEQARLARDLTKSNHLLATLLGESVPDVLREADALDRYMLDYVAAANPASRNRILRTVLPDHFSGAINPTDPTWRIGAAVRLARDQIIQGGGTNTISMGAQVMDFLGGMSLKGLMRRGVITVSSMFRSHANIATILAATKFIYDAGVTASPEFSKVAVGGAALSGFVIAAIGIPIGDYAMASAASLATMYSPGRPTVSSVTFKTALNHVLSVPRSGWYGKMKFILQRLDAQTKRTGRVSPMMLSWSLMLNHPTIAGTVLAAITLGMTANAIADLGQWWLIVRNRATARRVARASVTEDQRAALRNIERSSAEAFVARMGNLLRMLAVNVPYWVGSIAGFVTVGGTILSYGAGLLGLTVPYNMATFLLNKTGALNTVSNRTLAFFFQRFVDFVQVNSYLRVVGASVSLTLCLGSVAYNFIKGVESQRKREERIRQLPSVGEQVVVNDRAQSAVLTAQAVTDDATERLWDIAVFNSMSRDFPIAAGIQLIWNNLLQSTVASVVIWQILILLVPWLWRSYYPGLPMPAELESCIQQLEAAVAAAAAVPPPEDTSSL